MADDAARRRTPSETLKSINRSALIYPDRASMAPELECPICHDLLLVPIQCRVGHSVCAHCAVQAASAAARSYNVFGDGDALCPTCRAPMNLEEPTHNFALRTMIERLACRCPNSVEGHGAAGEGDCTWRGTFEVLEAHLGVCDCIPVPCPFAPYGCKAVLSAAAMRVHHAERAGFHSGLVADRFLALEMQISDMAVQMTTLHARVAGVGPSIASEMESAFRGSLSTVSARVVAEMETSVNRRVDTAVRSGMSTLTTRVADLETSVSRVDSAVRSAAAASTAVTALASAVPPLGWTVRWFIKNVPGNIQHKRQPHSKRFTVQVPGLGTYMMQFAGTFTKSGDFGFRINVLRDGCPAHSPAINLKGTTVELERPGYSQNLVREMSDESATAVQPGTNYGWETFCHDVDEYVRGDKTIVIDVVLKVQTEVTWV